MTQSEQQSGAVERLAEWLQKPAYDTSPTMGPQITRFGALLILTTLSTAILGVIWLVP